MYIFEYNATMTCDHFVQYAYTNTLLDDKSFEEISHRTREKINMFCCYFVFNKKIKIKITQKAYECAAAATTIYDIE